MPKITRKQITEATEMIFPDKIVMHKNGAVTFKRSYFYRHGQNEQLWADKVCDALEAAGFYNRVISSVDNWNAWPKDSYFEVKIEMSRDEIF